MGDRPEVCASTACCARQAAAGGAPPLGHDDHRQGEADRGVAVVHDFGPEVPLEDGAGVVRKIVGVHQLAEGVVGGSNHGEGHHLHRDAAPPDGVDADQDPTEQTSGHEHVEVYDGVQQFVPFHDSVQPGQIQNVEPTYVHAERGDGRADHTYGPTVQDAEEHSTARRGQRPERQGDGRGQCEQSGSSHADEQVLDDVKGEEFVVISHGRQDGRSDARRTAHHAPRTGGGPGVTAAAQVRPCHEVAPQGHDTHDEGDVLQHEGLTVSVKVTTAGGRS
jgi:hypothetical protein